MPSCVASSFSHGEAFISSKPERTTTRHVLAAEALERAAAVHGRVAAAQARSTRLPILSTWPKDTLDSQSMPMWMCAGRFLAAGNVEVAAARRAAADEDRVVALVEQRLHAVHALARAQLGLQVEDVADLFVDHRLGQAELRDLRYASSRRRSGRPRRSRRGSRAAAGRALR